MHVHVYYEGQLKNLVDTYFVFTFIEVKFFYLPITSKAVKTVTSATSNGNWNCVFRQSTNNGYTEIYFSPLKRFVKISIA